MEQLKNCITVLLETKLYSSDLQKVPDLTLINKLMKYVKQSPYLPVGNARMLHNLTTFHARLQQK